MGRGRGWSASIRSAARLVGLGIGLGAQKAMAAPRCNTHTHTTNLWCGKQVVETKSDQDLITTTYKKMGKMKMYDSTSYLKSKILFKSNIIHIKANTNDEPLITSRSS
jgi:hypothetical protein